MYACPKRKSLRYQCCGVRFGTGIGIPQTGNRAYRKRACACPRDLSALELERQVSLVRGCRVGSLVSIIIIVRSGRFQLLFSPLSFFSSSLSRLLRFFRGPFFLGTHSRTHVTCARSTRHSRMRYAYVRGFFDVTNLNASSVDRWREGEGRASAPPIFLLWTGIGSSLEMLVLLENLWILLFMQFSDLISSFFFPS